LNLEALLAFQASQIREDQIRKIITVSPLQQAEDRHAQFAKGFPQPMIILRFERFLGQWVPRISVETGGNPDQFRFKILKMLERAGENLTVFSSRSLRGYRKIETVVSNVSAACAGITGILMNRKERHARMVHEDVLGAIAVVHVKIKNGDALNAGRERFDRPRLDCVMNWTGFAYMLN